VQSVYGITNEAHAGAFLGGDGTLLAAQLVTAACVCAWTMGTCMASLCVIKYLPKLLRLTDQADCLRVPLKQELAGLDVSYHAGWEFPPYLMPLVENLRALTQVQEKLAEQATHVGSYGDLLGQVRAHHSKSFSAPCAPSTCVVGEGGRLEGSDWQRALSDSVCPGTARNCVARNRVQDPN
jgi:hypothetical protein